MDFETEESKRRAEFYKSHTSENAEKRNDFRESLIAHQSEGKQTSEDSITNGNELPREQFKKQDGPSID